MKAKILLALVWLFAGFSGSAQTYPYAIPNLDNIVTVTGPTGLDVKGVANTVNKVNGNVYVCGYIAGTTKDLFIAKFDSNIVQQWIYTYDNGYDDKAFAITVDASDNVYVTGGSEQATNNSDIITIMLNSAGTQQFAARSNGTANSADIGNSIAFDGTNIWVAGYTTQTAKGKDFTILKYNTSGTLLTSTKKNGTANADETANKLYLFGSNLYVTGSIQNATNTDILTMCINTTSSTITWTNTVNGSASGADEGKDVVADANHVVICGNVNNTGTGDDYYLAVITASSGVNSYTNTYDGYSGSDIASSITKDKLGNYVVTGAVTNGSNTEYHTRQYSASALNWTHVQPINCSYTTTYPHITADTLNHFYVCGTYSNSTQDGILYQLSPSGNRSWVQYEDGSNSGKDIHSDLIVDGIGRVYVSSVNESATPNSYYVKLLRYSQTPAYMPCNYNLQADTFSMAHLFYPNSGEITDTAFSAVPQVLFYTKYSGPTEFILKDRVAFCETKQDTARSNPKDTLSRVDMIFMGANEGSGTFAFDYQSNATLSYFLSYTGTNGITGVAGASHLMVPNIWPLIDLHYSSNANGAKYYFVVKPGGNPGNIRIQFDGAASTTITSNNLKINSPFSSWTFNKPDIYYVSVPSYTNLTVTTTSVTGTNGWVSMGSDTYSINPGTYNAAWPLVIEFDKGKTGAAQNINNIKWSTYIGSGSMDRIQESKCDVNANLFTVGQTYANFFPGSAGSYQSNLSGNSDGFLSKFDLNGVLKWTSYLGSSGADRLNGLDFNPTTQEIYCVGFSNKGDLILHDVSMTAPTWAYSGTTGKTDGIIAKFDQAGSTADWITYFGGSSDDIFTACKFDPSANFFTVGYSKSTDFIVSRTHGTEYQHNVNSNSYYDGVIARFDGSYQLTWSTGIGATTAACALYSSPDDYLFDCDVSDAGSKDFYVVGSSFGCDYPNVTNGGSTNRSYTDLGDAVVTHFSNIGNMIYSSYFGGSSGYDEAYTITIKHGISYIGGASSSSGISTVNSSQYYYQAANAGSENGTFMVLTLGDGLFHYTFVGGSSSDGVTDVMIDNNNTIYLVGVASSNNFPGPVSNPANTYSQGYEGNYDNFICALQQWNGIVWMTYLGGTQQETSTVFYDRTASVCSDVSGNVFVTGLTLSSSSQQFPLDNGGGVPWFNNVLSGPQDATITKFDVVALLNIGIKENQQENSDILLYPNPTLNNINLVLKDDAKDVIFTIFDCTGKIVEKGQLKNRINALRVSDYSNGIYFIELQDASGYKYVNKFIKSDQ